MESRSEFWFFTGSVLSLIYAIVRYVVYGPYTLAHDLLFIINKTFALSVVIGLLLLTLEKDNNVRKKLGKLSFYLTVGHAVLSLLLFKSYFLLHLIRHPFLTFLSIFSGFLGLFWMYRLFMGIKKKKIRPLSYLYENHFMYIVIFSVLHVIFWGIYGWLSPGKWYGGLIPLTVLSAIILTFTFLGLKRKRQ